MSQKIVFIDDDCDEHDFVAEAFKTISDEISLFAFTDPKLAIQRLTCTKSALEPDLVLLDINMPGLNGFEVLQQIKSIKSLQHIPIYIFSTSREPEDKLKARRLGADAYFSKPDSLEGYYKTARRLLMYWRKQKRAS